VIAIAESQASSQQLLQSERVNTETRALLADVRATTQGLHATLSDQFDTVLRAALGPAIAEASKDGEVSPEELEARIVDKVEDALRQFRTPAATSTSMSHLVSRSAAPEDERVIKHMTTYPDEEEGLRLLSILNELTPLQAELLRSRASQEIRTRRAGRLPPAWVLPSGRRQRAEALFDQGLAREIDRPPRAARPEDPDDTFYELTDLGRDVARLLMGRGEPPEWLLRNSGRVDNK
jgi:hypothetical protein